MYTVIKLNNEHNTELLLYCRKLDEELSATCSTLRG